MEEKQDGNGGRPFQLRPSILSGTGFGSSFGGFGSPGDKTTKEFTLRPSALTSATDHLESDSRKRLHEDDDSRKRLHEDDETDPSKVNKEETTKKLKTTAGENGKKESPVKLTEEIQKPAGIGTFGFSKVDATKADKLNNKSEEKNSTNFFQVANTDTNKFVFGDNSNTSNIVGFNTLKSENDNVVEETEIGSTNGGDDEKEIAVVTVDNEKLLESADEYQKSIGERTHFEQVEQITGEEGERNVLQIFCKLHLFDKRRQTWLEKGRGTLKLNDKCHSEGVFQSRLVFRTQGTNIVLLNMMLWPNMCCERVKDKSIRITAIDPETKEVKVYLITTAIKDCLQTYIAIDRRIEALKRNSDSTDDSKNDMTAGSGNSSKPHTDDEDSSTESERISSRENSMHGPTDNDSSDQTSPGQTTT